MTGEDAAAGEIGSPCPRDRLFGHTEFDYVALASWPSSRKPDGRRESGEERLRSAERACLDFLAVGVFRASMLATDSTPETPPYSHAEALTPHVEGGYHQG